MRKNKLIFAKICIFLFISFIIVNISLYVYAFITPKLDLNTANQILIYDNKDALAFENIDGSKWVSFDEISKNIKNATISVEDKHFYTHRGFDYLRILKAFITNFLNNSIDQGASTISQQYIKNLFLTFDKTWSRKIEEAFLTLELEVHYSKDDILEGYLNTIDYSAGNYGIESASNYYFNKNAKDLTLAEASIIVGIPKNPSLYNPITNFEKAKKRQKTVLDSMVKNKYITKGEADKIYKEELVFYGKKNEMELSSLMYYKDAVISELNTIKEIPKSLIDTGGLKIYTNLDTEIQKKLENVIKEEMADKSDLQVASIIVGPKTGKVLALVGGTNYSVSQFNRVTQAKRQVGSTIKPILYYAALENGFTASSTFLSEATTFNIGNNKIYSPQNANGVYANKEISLASAIAYSDNIYAIKTHLFLGENTLVNAAARMGIATTLEPNPSLPLGTNEISMLDYSNAFSTLANEGIKNKNYFITKVTNMNGKILYEYKYNEEVVLNKRYVYVLNELLTNTYNYSFVNYTSPTMLSVNNILTRKYAAKSGSTSSDYWTVGYNPDLLVMVWNGYDDNRNISSAYARLPKRIWARSIESALEGKETSWYDIPYGVTASLVNPVSGEIKTTDASTLLFYIKGTEPSVDIENNKGMS
jgi:1A family penicillin-binding protein